MAFKEDRKLKVYEGGYTKPGSWNNTKYKFQPQIRLQGDWLADLGFNPGSAMNVHCEKGRLTITLVGENEAAM